MCLLDIQAQCYERFFEVSANEVENAELVVEDMVSSVLLDLFGEGMVDEVMMQFSSHPGTRLQECAIQIRAQCACQSFTLPRCTRKHMEQAVERDMHTLLKELFGQVKVRSMIQCRSLVGIDSTSW
jgi:hypothetical protein